MSTLDQINRTSEYPIIPTDDAWRPGMPLSPLDALKNLKNEAQLADTALDLDDHRRATGEDYCNLWDLLQDALMSAGLLDPATYTTGPL